MLLLSSGESYSAPIMLGPTFIDTSTIIDEKLPRFKVSTRYSRLSSGQQPPVTLTGQTDAQSFHHDRDEHVTIQLPLFPPRSPSSGNSLHSSSSSSPLDSTRTVITSMQTEVIFGQATSNNPSNISNFNKLNAFSFSKTEQTPRTNTSNDWIVDHNNNYDEFKVTPDIIASTFGDETPSREDKSQWQFTEPQKQSNLLNVTCKKLDSTDNTLSSELSMNETDQNSNLLDIKPEQFFVTDHSERISRVDAIVEELSEKMLQLRGGSSCVLSNLEQTIRLLGQVKASFEVQQQRDLNKDDGYVGCADIPSDPEPITHLSNAATTPHIQQNGTVQSRLSAASQESDSSGDRAGVVASIGARYKSHQWDLDMCSQNKNVSKTLTTSQSTYEVSSHENFEQAYTTFIPRPNVPLIPIPQESGFASSSSSVNKPTRRTALHFAAALFRTSSRDRAMNANSSSSSSSTPSAASGPGRYFKRRSKSKDQACRKPISKSHTKSVEIRPTAPVICDR